MYAMIVLTAIVGVTTAVLRIKSAYAGVVDPRYFKLMGNYDIPDDIAKFGRNFNNLFEVPTLFYAAAITALALDITSPFLILMAWTFVILRVIHCGIHLTYNHPLHRFIPFFLSFVCTFVMWTNIVLNLPLS